MAKKSLDELLEEALVPEAEQPYRVPNNWVWTKLGIACTINPPKAKSVNALQDDEPTSFVPMSAVDEGTGSIKQVLIRKYDEVKKGYTYFQEGDILFAKITPCMENGKVCIARDLFKGFGFGSTEFHTVRTMKCANVEYIYHILRSEDFRKEAKYSMTGAVGQQRVPKEFISNSVVPLPPIEEQQRIGNVIESLFVKLDRARELISEAREEFEHRKIAVLAKAFRGELTAKWRKENKQPNNDLLKIIMDYYTKNSTIKDIKNIQEFQQMVSIIEDIEYSVWYKCAIGAIGIVCNGSTPSRSELKYWNGEIPWVSSGEVRNNVIDITNERITEEGLNKSSVRLLKAGTVLIAMIGEGKTRGQTSILNLAATINQNIAAIDLSHGAVLSRFLWYWLQYQYKRNREEGNGTGPKALNCQKVRELSFVLPPLLEQKEIVRILDKLLDEESKINELTQLEVQIALTKRAILAKAFRGELGTNNPGEESALKLLKELLLDKVS